MAETVTARQSAILRFIEGYVTEKGYSPTFREIGAAVGLVSPSSVAFQISRLEALGAISWEHGKPRTIRVVKPGPIGLAHASTLLTDVSGSSS